MKTFLEPPKLTNSKIPSPKACLIANALILPGSGSLMRRRREGYFQVTVGALGLVITGFATAGLLQFLGNMNFDPSDPDGAATFIHQAGPALIWVGSGLALFGFAWVWSLLSSAAIYREDRQARELPGDLNCC